MENKEKIITRTHELLVSIGPTSMTMDMVAHACGISKRTLYETFPDKKTLIMECIKVDHLHHHQEACRIYRESSNCFEALFCIFKMVRQYFNKRSQAFIDDLKRLYPDVVEQQREGEKILITQLSEVLKQGQEEGLVSSKVNTDLASMLYFTLMNSLHNNPRISDMGFNPSQVYEAAFINFMRGMATQHGQEVIEEAIKKYL